MGGFGDSLHQNVLNKNVSYYMHNILMSDEFRHIDHRDFYTLIHLYNGYLYQR